MHTGHRDEEDGLFDRKGIIETRLPKKNVGLARVAGVTKHWSVK